MSANLPPSEVLRVVLDEARARGRAEALAEVADLLRDARCSLADPGLRMAWGRERKRLLDEAVS